MALDLPDKPAEGDPGHVPDTALIIDALNELDEKKVEDLVAGTVWTGAPGSAAAVTIHGGPGTHTLDFIIPQGPQGLPGATGSRGPAGPLGPQGPEGP